MPLPSTFTARFTPLSDYLTPPDGWVGNCRVAPPNPSMLLRELVLLTEGRGYGPATAVRAFPELNPVDTVIYYRYDITSGGVDPISNQAFQEFDVLRGFGTGVWLATNRAQLDALSVATAAPNTRWIFQFYIGNP